MIDVLLAAVLAQDPFEPNARDLARDVPGVTLEFERLARYERFARSGHERLFARDPRTWFPYVLQGVISDNFTITAASLRALRELCARHHVTDAKGENPVRLERLNSAAYRAELYKTCAAWYHQNKDGLGRARASFIPWKELMRDLGSGGAWTDPSRREGRAFASIKSQGSDAWPILASYVADDDLPTAKAAVRALNLLTGRDTPLPTESTRDDVRNAWKGWLRENGHAVAPDGPDLLPLLSDVSSEDDTRALLRRLESGDIEARETAARQLRGRRFRHEALLRDALATADQPEVRVALGLPLDEIPDLKLMTLELRDDPVWLRAALGRLRRETPDPAAFGRRVDRLLASFQEIWTEMRDLDHRRATIAKACDLDLPGRARWADALTDWEAFVEDVDASGELLAAVEAERARINEAAVRDAEAVRLEALRRFKTASNREVILYLAEQADRFEGTDGHEAVRTVQRILFAP